MSFKILFVDDDVNILNSCKRQFRKKWEVYTAQGAEEGLLSLADQGPIALVISDMRMPGMNGVEFLGEVKESYPEVVRIMLTGNADLQTAIDAVNEGNIFRFLTKPCDSATMEAAIQAGLEQYHLIVAERELMEKTLRGSVKVLTEVLSLVNPHAFSQTSRLKKYVRHVATELKLKNVWQYEIAAMLSQIGCVTLPPSVLMKIYARRKLSVIEEKMFASHPTIACKLLANIPRMGSIARIIEKQQEEYPGREAMEALSAEELRTSLGGQILKASIDFDQLITRAVSVEVAVRTLRKRKDIVYNPTVLDAMETFDNNPVEVEIKTLPFSEVEIGMVTDQAIKSKKGTLLLQWGHEITYTVLERLHNFSKGEVGIIEPIRVRVPLSDEEETPALRELVRRR